MLDNTNIIIDLMSCTTNAIVILIANYILNHGHIAKFNILK